jgi:hypothetical protein
MHHLGRRTNAHEHGFLHSLAQPPLGMFERFELVTHTKFFVNLANSVLPVKAAMAQLMQPHIIDMFT